MNTSASCAPFPWAGRVTLKARVALLQCDLRHKGLGQKMLSRTAVVPPGQLVAPKRWSGFHEQTHLHGSSDVNHVPICRDALGTSRQVRSEGSCLPGASRFELQGSVSADAAHSDQLLIVSGITID